MNSPGIIDDYLEGLLHEAIAEEQKAPPPRPVAVARTETETAAPAPAPAGPTPEQIAAAVLAEADADPALAGIMSRQAPAPTPAGPTPEQIAAAVLAEADADPALAGIMSAQAPTPAERQADLDVVAAMERQCAAAPRDLATEDDAAAAIAVKRAPMAVPPERRAEAERARTAASRLPPNLEAFMAPAVPHGSAIAPERLAERSTRWLRLRCGEQAYALELLKVQEVVLPVPLLALRGTPPSMLGIMNLRGQVVPVLDLGMHLGAAPIEMDMQTRVVVLEENGNTLGLRVSAVEDVASLTDQQIEPPDNARICRISNHLFRGVARLAQQPMILLDAEGLLH